MLERARGDPTRPGPWDRELEDEWQGNTLLARDGPEGGDLDAGRVGVRMRGPVGTLAGKAGKAGGVMGTSTGASSFDRTMGGLGAGGVGSGAGVVFVGGVTVLKAGSKLSSGTGASSVLGSEPDSEAGGDSGADLEAGSDSEASSDSEAGSDSEEDSDSETGSDSEAGSKTGDLGVSSEAGSR